MGASDDYSYTGPEPLNREPEIEKLVSSFITDDGFNRNHGDIPQLSADTHTIRIDGAVRSPISLTISQLEKDYAQHEVICALQCAGNRRHTMRTLLKEVQGIDWFEGAVMNCSWRGPRLTDILRTAGLQLGDSDDGQNTYDGWHVAFACHSTPCQEDSWYGGSIPLARAMKEDGDVILALQRNGKTLTPEHGYPVRAVAPGIIGARSVKWLDQITIQKKESDNHYEQRDYKVLPPEAVDAESAAKFWEETPPLLETSINSAIALPKTGSTVERDEKGMVEVKGYALPAGDDGPITKVVVSADEGKSWTEAELLDFAEGGEPSRYKFAWRLWKAQVRLDPGSDKQVWSRAFDQGGNAQHAEAVWNLRGVNYDGYGQVRDLTVK